MFEETKGADSPIVIQGKHDTKADPMMVLAVMIILVVFIFVIFAIFAFRNERRHHDGGHGLAEAATAAIVAQTAARPAALASEYNYVSHDNCKELGNVKVKIVETAAASDAKTAGYFYATEKAIEAAKLEAYKVAVEQAEKTRTEISAIESQRRQDELARERENNLFHRVVAAVGPRAPYPCPSPYAPPPMYDPTHAHAHAHAC